MFSVRTKKRASQNRAGDDDKQRSDARPAATPFSKRMNRSHRRAQGGINPKTRQATTTFAMKNIINLCSRLHFAASGLQWSYGGLSPQRTLYAQQIGGAM